MNEINPPVQSLKSLALASVASILFAFFILITIIFPAEYGIDLTGVGKKMGLTVLAESAQEPVKPAVLSCNEPTSEWADSVKITVPANKGLEYKFHLAKGATLNYSWKTDGGKLYFDFHGEPKNDKTGYFKSFEEDTGSQSSGSLITPFEGSHGWYWENKSRSPVTVLLNTKGDYHILGLM